MRRASAAVLLLCLCINPLRAQFFTLGGDPARARWRQIESRHFTVIYPARTDSLARACLVSLEYYRPRVFEGVMVEGRRIPVVLHPYTTLSNGAVTWAPKRIDLFTTPESYGGLPDPWIDQLTSHELRHQAQMETLAEGVYKVLYYPFGECISGLGAGAYIGSVYMEGDAVATETELLGCGRGRSASFHRFYRMAMLTGDVRSFYRYDNGSYRLYTPDKYAFGYQIVASDRRSTGDYRFTGRFLKFTRENWINMPSIFSPNLAVSGYSKSGQWGMNWTRMTDFWREDLGRRGPVTAGVPVSGRIPRLYTEYLSPVAVPRTTAHAGGTASEACSVHAGEAGHAAGASEALLSGLPEAESLSYRTVAVRKGMEESPVLVSIDPGGRETVLRPFNSVSSALTYDGRGRLWWTERRMAGGSTLEDFSVLRYMDIGGGGTHTFGGHVQADGGARAEFSKTRWFNPSISPDGNIAAVTEYPVEGGSCAVLLDIASGRVISRVKAPAGGQVKETAFIGDELYATVILGGGLGIYRLGPDAASPRGDSTGPAGGQDGAVRASGASAGPAGQEGTVRTPDSSAGPAGAEDLGGWVEVVAPQHRSIVRLRSTGRLLYFCSDLDGVENIYTLDPGSGRLTRVTNSLYGADYPYFSPADGSLLCSDYGSKGFSIKRISADSLICAESSFEHPFIPPAAVMLAEQRQSQSLFAAGDSCTDAGGQRLCGEFGDPAKYPSVKYSRFTHLLRFHSWAPVYYNVDNILNMTFDRFYEAASLGAVAYSQNTLGTAVTMVGYSAHTSPDPGRAGGSRWFHSGHVKFTYTGICPHIEASVDVNDRLRIHYGGVNLTTEGTACSDSTRYYMTGAFPMYVAASLRLYYPVYLNGGGWSRSIIPQAGWFYQNDEYVAADGASADRGRVVAGLSYTQTRPVAKSQIYPRLGFSLTALYSAAPFSGAAFGSLGYLYSYLYLPGVVLNQGLKLSFTWQKQYAGDGQHLLPSTASMPRGYRYNSPTGEYVKAAASYAAPVWLGDLHIGGDVGLYLKRLQLLPFYEWARDRSRIGAVRTFSSAGCDVLIDFRILPIAADLSAGVRYARIGSDPYITAKGPVEPGRNTFQLLFNINF